MDTKVFPNGFSSWQETHFEVVKEITREDENGEYFHESVAEIHLDNGIGGLWELAEELTDKFEKEHQGVEWGQDENADWLDALDEFLTVNLK